MLSLVPLYILAQTVAPVAVPGDDPVAWLLSMLKWIVEQFQAGNYLPAISGVVMVVIAVFHRFFEDRIPKRWLPLVSAGVGVLTAVALNMLDLALGCNKTDVLHALSTGLMVGSGASGFYSLAGKAIMEKVFPRAELPAAPVPALAVEVAPVPVVPPTTPPVP